MNKIYRNETEKLIWKLCGLAVLSVIFYLEGYYLMAVNSMGGGGSLAVLVNFNAISSIIAIWVAIFNFKGKNIDKTLKALFYGVIIISPIFVLTNLFGGGWILLFSIIKQYKKRDSKELTLKT